MHTYGKCVRVGIYEVPPKKTGGAVAVRRSRPRKSLPTRQEVQEANSSTEPNATSNATGQYQPVDYLPERG